MKRIPLEVVGLRALRRGDIVCNLGSGNSYVVESFYLRDGRLVAIAVDTVQVSVPGEWELVRYEGDEP